MAPMGILAIVGAILAIILGVMVWLVGAIHTMAICFGLVSVVMMLIILAQKPKGGGLSGAFGGGGGGGADAAFGAKAGDMLTWATIICFVTFLGLAMGLTWAINLDHQPQAPVPATTTMPSPAGAEVPFQDFGEMDFGAPAGGDPATTGQPATPPAQPAAPQPPRGADPDDVQD
jgi:preprotein translocase subunit SecG